MKILVMSLLRLGDIILATPVLKGLRDRYPDADIHLLVNKQFAGISPLIPFVNRVHHFDRRGIQEGLTSPDRSLLEAYDRLQAQVNDLNENEFDQVINVTHNRLSGWVSSLIKSSDKRGLTLNPTGPAGYGSPWFKYLNDYIAAGGKEVFHYIDVFYYGSGLQGKNRQVLLQESQAGVEEANAIVGETDEFIAVQPLTSDDKKNWSLESYAEAIRLIRMIHPDTRVVLLGAPFEIAELEACQSMCAERGVSVELGVCSFEGAFSILNRAKLLLTGDTSIKHLASGADCQIVELSLGSSDYRKTGAYKEGSLIIQSQESCAPCGHSESCHRKSHACAERVSPELVSLVVSKVLEGNKKALRVVAKEFKDQADILGTHFSYSGFWVAQSVAETFNEWSLEKWVDRSCWKFLLDKEHLKPIGEYGSESLRIKMTLQKVFPEESQERWRSVLSVIEKKAEETEEKIHEILSSLTASIRVFGNEAPRGRLYRTLQGIDDESPSVAMWMEIAKSHVDSKNGIDFKDLRSLQEALKEISERNQIKLKLVRSMKTNPMEQL